MKKTIMKNVHLIPTDKPSKMQRCGLSEWFDINKENLIDDRYKWQHLYIASEEEIKEGWYFNIAIAVNKPVYVENEDIKGLKNLYGGKPTHLLKIILTTDQDLIADGVQAIDDEFLEWFVKNPSCENIEIEKWTDYKLENGKEIPFFKYKIIIPQEESSSEYATNSKLMTEFGKSIQLFIDLEKKLLKEEPKQQTLEQAAKQYKDLKLPDDLYDAFIAGAKWQEQRMIDLKELEKEIDALLASETPESLRKWFEQFKKK